MKRHETALVFACATVLLSYPDGSFSEDMAATREAIERLPKCKARTELASTLVWLSAKNALEAAANYVETFDLQKRRSLHLTYYLHGDTRERGLALSALVGVYRKEGFELTSGELPDYLPALLELAAFSSAGATILLELRPSIVLLRNALEKAKSPYGRAVAAVLEALGSISKTDKLVIERYKTQGPPTEKVGFEPFVPSELLGQRVVIR